jgi:hypothetical protein
LQDPFSGIQVFNEVPLNEEGTCCSIEDDDDLEKPWMMGITVFLIDHGVEKKPSLMDGMPRTLTIQTI